MLAIASSIIHYVGWQVEEAFGAITQLDISVVWTAWRFRGQCLQNAQGNVRVADYPSEPPTSAGQLGLSLRAHSEFAKALCRLFRFEPEAFVSPDLASASAFGTTVGWFRHRTEAHGRDLDPTLSNLSYFRLTPSPIGETLHPFPALPVRIPTNRWWNAV
jgi:hypothetical protein